jgi:hypothetical protein
VKRTGWLIILVIALVVVGAVEGNLLGRANGDNLKSVTGIIGSEKQRFFADPEVREVFAKRGFAYRVDPAGSREMAGGLAGYDFAFPSSKPAADELVGHRPAVGAPVTAFSSPLAIATFTPVVDVLYTAGLARRDERGVWTLDLKALVDKNQADLKWNQISANTTHNVAQNVLVATTRPQDSNSAAMFAVILNQVTGGDLAAVAKLFSDQGAVDTTSEEPFESYLRSGKDFAPMVLVYEAQFVDHVHNTGAAKGQTLIYPAPTLVCAHTVVPFTAAGRQVADLLSTDADLQRLAAKHGFRTVDPAVSAPVLQGVRSGDVALPDKIVDAVEPPNQPALQTLLRKVEDKLT